MVYNFNNYFQFYNYSKESIKKILSDTDFVSDIKIFEIDDIKKTF